MQDPINIRYTHTGNSKQTEYYLKQIRLKFDNKKKNKEIFFIQKIKFTKPTYESKKKLKCQKINITSSET